ncbi:hypothetical protein D3C84_490560 [compost metagenome]
MPIRPAPITLTCPKCNWQHTLAPRSDAIFPGEWPEHCPRCRHDQLQKRAATWMETLLAKLPTRDGR